MRHVPRPIGVQGLRRYGGYTYEEFLPYLRWPRAGEIYKEMADNDPVIGAILYMAEMLIRKAGWSVKAGGSTDEDLKAKKFLEECLDDMDDSWADTICEILSVLTYGFSFHEIVYKVRRTGKSKYTDGRIGWKGLPIRSQDTLLEWEFNEETSEATGFVQLAYPNYTKVVIPFSKGLLFRTRVRRGNPEGKSLLRNAYRPWYFKKRIEEIEGIGVERDLAGLPVLKAPEGMDLWSTEDPRMIQLRAQAETLVQSIRRDAEEGILLPYGWELSLLASNSKRQFDTNAIVNRYDNRIAITMLSDIVLIGGDKTGSFALADTKKSLLATALEAQLANIAEVINKHAIPKLFAMNNFKEITCLPKLVPGEIEAPDIKEIALLLRAVGLDISGDLELQNHLRRITSMPELTEELFKKIYAAQGRAAEEGQREETAPGKKNSKKDEQNAKRTTVDRDFEQNDLDYTGQ